MSALGLLVAWATGTALAAKTEAAPPEDPPPWSTASGREETKIELLETFIDGGSYEAALSLIATMRTEGSHSTRLDLLQGRTLRLMGLYDDAESLLTELTQSKPHWAEAQNELGILWVDRHQTDKALAAFGAAVKLDDANANFRNNLGFTQLISGKPQDAVTTLREALRLDGSDARIRNNLGQALAAAGEEQQAFRMFRSAESEADAHYNLGVALAMRGDTEAARAQYRAALDADPTHYLSNRALATMAPPAPSAIVNTPESSP